VWLAAAAGQAQAAIAEVGVSSAANLLGTSDTINQPSGVTSGEVLVATVTVSGTAAITPPSGWTVISDTTTSTMRQTSYFHVTGNSEPTSWAFALGSIRAAAGGIIAYSGVNTNVPVDASAACTSASAWNPAGISAATTSYCAN